MDERDLREASESLASIRRSIDEMRKIESAKPEPERIVIEPRSESDRESRSDSESIWATVEPYREPRGLWSRRPFWLVPALLYVATWITTTGVGTLFYGGGSIWTRLLFSAPLMIILTCHELGHYVQNRRYKIATTLPYFIPLPIPPLGTFGAIIQMKGVAPSVRAIFDVGISGPLAGLAVTLVFMAIGLANSTVVPIADVPATEGALIFGEPLIFQWAARLILGYDPKVHELLMHPTAIAAWVGILLTTLNLLPVGQLDGGHVFYALTGKRAKVLARIVFWCAAAGVVLFKLWNWTLLLVLVYFLGIAHPRVGGDQKLGLGRTILGWATLAFLVLGFTPKPLEVL